MCFFFGVCVFGWLWKRDLNSHKVYGHKTIAASGVAMSVETNFSKTKIRPEIVRAGQGLENKLRAKE